MIDLRAKSRNVAGGIEALIDSKLGNIRRPIRIVDIPLVIGARGVVLAVNDHVFFRLGLNGQVTILTWSLGGTIGATPTAGTITVDVLAGSTLATVATIASTQKPALSAQIELADQTPGNLWTTQVSDPQWIMAKVTSTGGTLEVVSLTLRCAVDSR